MDPVGQKAQVEERRVGFGQRGVVCPALSHQAWLWGPTTPALAFGQDFLSLAKEGLLGCFWRTTTAAQ